MPSKSTKTENSETQVDDNDKRDVTLETCVQNISLEESEKINNEPFDENKNDQIDENNNEEDNEDDNDDEGWINPSNIKQIKKDNQIDSEEQDIKDLKLKVACMTADFAMQVIFFFINK